MEKLVYTFSDGIQHIQKFDLRDGLEEGPLGVDNAVDLVEEKLDVESEPTDLLRNLERTLKKVSVTSN